MLSDSWASSRAAESRPAHAFPAERQLAASLSVGRSAVREALAALEILGVVVVRPGSGTYLRDGSQNFCPKRSAGD
ncbi:FadR/GntR family transcriptional regulator [Paenarthrobacter ureafaciens]|uniref:FadR/GntR family transcriptional regulator n=1 Tax=Paenarthrobacter ureafaciens TaxID=37931 RepID=UPI00308419B7